MFLDFKKQPNTRDQIAQFQGWDDEIFDDKIELCDLLLKYDGDCLEDSRKSEGFCG